MKPDNWEKKMRNKELQGLLRECGSEVITLIATFDRCDRVAKKTEAKIRSLLPENEKKMELEVLMPLLYSISRDNAIRLASKQAELSRFVESTYVDTEHGKKVLGKVTQDLCEMNLAMSILEVSLSDIYDSLGG